MAPNATTDDARSGERGRELVTGAISVAAILMFVGIGSSVQRRRQKALEREAPAAVPIAELAGAHLRATLAGTFGVVACFALYYIATTFVLGYGTTALGYSRSAFLQTQLISILFMAIGIALAGWLSDRSTPARVLAGGCVGVVLAGVLLMGDSRTSPVSTETLMSLAIRW